MDIHAKLKDLDLKLPAAPKPAAAYVPFVRSGDLVFVSGQGPTVDGKPILTGRVGDSITLEQAQEAARVCALNALAVLSSAIDDDWSRFMRIVRVGVYVSSADNFNQQPMAGNGASELLEAVFGEAGRHARTAIGLNVLPFDIPVEVDMIAQVK